MAMAGAALLDAIGQRRQVCRAAVAERRQQRQAVDADAEWITLMFFLGLFTLVHGVVKVGLIGMAAKGMLDVTGARAWAATAR